jgi:hypothetical protein
MITSRSDSASARHGAGRSAHDHVPVSDSASVAWLLLGPAIAVSGARAEISVVRAGAASPLPARRRPPSAATPAPPIAEKVEDGELSAPVQLQLTKRQWDIAMVAGGAGLGEIAGGKLGSLIGAGVLIIWWRWMLKQAKKGRL